MSWNGQAHFKDLAEMLQDFSSVSDHFTTLRSKGLNNHKSSTFKDCCSETHDKQRVYSHRFVYLQAWTEKSQRHCFGQQKFILFILKLL